MAISKSITFEGLTYKLTDVHSVDAFSALQGVDGTYITPSSIIYWIPLINEASSIWPSAHQPALFLTQVGTLAASALETIVNKSKRPVIPANNIFNTKKTFLLYIWIVPIGTTSA